MKAYIQRQLKLMSSIKPNTVDASKDIYIYEGHLNEIIK